MSEFKDELASLKGLPVEIATSFEPSEIKGDKPNVELFLNGQDAKDVTVKGK